MPNTTIPTSSRNTQSNGFCSCSCAGPQPQGMDISELEFVQMIIILLVMTFMMVVIICLLNHYRLSALAFLSRLSPNQRDQATQLDASVWSDSVLTQQRNSEVMCSRLNRNLPCFMQQQQLCRLQPTYPHLPQEIINLPPIICLSDGEELPPYKGPCGLQLRHPEQQLELIRAAVRAPPNRTVFDSDIIDIYIHSKRLQEPKSNSGTNDASARVEAPPPSYSEVMGDYSTSTDWLGSNSSQTVFHSGSSGPESTAKASTDLKKSWQKETEGS
ncbi:low-density lipoprotein receptor class A domain-containing protein 4-like [Scomber japonicus]|uniref:low-density lipoprotein receptor class A domain-containing protein 4-like n=1 Tax=Scomber japonicus TaxID=13676 RepID=UPI002306572C|nr:low-density lipoprotein receptor class A domain-containing protein 4-like [Scomber japonicus]